MTHALSKPFILIDGSSYLYRAFNALPALTTRQGEPTGAMYGVLSMIKKLIAEYEPDYIGIVFDPRGKTARHAIYPEYKAHRPHMPAELSAQITPLFTLIKAMGLPLIQIEGIEADDVMATLACHAMQAGQHTLIATSDKDMAQLVNAHIRLVDTMKGTVLDREGVIRKFEVPPERITDYLALIGDTSDNLPGIPKVGPKTAVTWLQTYGSLDEIISHSDKISGKVGESLRASLSDLPKFKQLVTLDCAVPLPCTFIDLQRQPEHTSDLCALYQQFEFHTWLKTVQTEANTSLQISKEYQVILTQDALEAWVDHLEKAGLFALHLETNHQSVFDPIIGIAFSSTPHQAAYLPLGHTFLTITQLPTQSALKTLKPLLENSNHTVIGQDIKYVIGVLACHGIQLKTSLFDTGLASYVLNSAHRHDLNTLARHYLDKQTIKLEDITGKGMKRLSLDQIDIDNMKDYGDEKADILLQLHTTLQNRLETEDETDSLWVFNEIELPLIPVLSRMEQYGVRIDAHLLAELSHSFAKRITKLEEEAYHLAGQMFNLSSPKQLQEILYQQMKLPVLEKTPTGAPSTAESVLQILALDFPLPKILLEHRRLSKLKSTYTDSLPKQVHAKTGRIHTSYNQAITSTGRLSSTDPNLQNIPIRHEAGHHIRQAFIPDRGYIMVSADYSQIELRIMAHLSQDPQLLKAFAQGLDVHAATASELFSVTLDKVTSEQRRHAKAINFGLIYGMSSFGLAKQLGIPRELAQTYMDQYFDKYPGVQRYMEETRTLAHQMGYVKTLHGRKVYLPDIQSTQLQRRRAAERAAINAPMQGTAAEMIKLAMITLDDWIQQQEPSLAPRMIMQVHDELVFEIPKAILETVIPMIRDKMTHVVTFSVPLEVTIKAGHNWDEAH